MLLSNRVNFSYGNFVCEPGKVPYLYPLACLPLLWRPHTNFCPSGSVWPSPFFISFGMPDLNLDMSRRGCGNALLWLSWKRYGHLNSLTSLAPSQQDLLLCARAPSLSCSLLAPLFSYYLASLLPPRSAASLLSCSLARILLLILPSLSFTQSFPAPITCIATVFLF